MRTSLGARLGDDGGEGALRTELGAKGDQLGDEFVALDLYAHRETKGDEGR